jgi:hypothetical protein
VLYRFFIFLNCQRAYFILRNLYYHLFKFPLWCLKLKLSYDESIRSNDKLCIILLSYKRSKNIKWIVNSVCKCNFVDTIFVSNNNPEINIYDFFKPNDARVKVLCQNSHSPPALRFDIASQIESYFFMCIDDDIFLLPYQIKTLFLQLIKNPSIPHGTYGSEISINFNSIDGRIRPKVYSKHHFQVNREVDEIYQIYTFTKFHVLKYFQLINEYLVKNERTDILNFCDDIILSSSGDGRPIIHNVGKILACCSFDNEKIAVYKTTGFEDFRNKVRLLIHSRRNHFGM